MKQTDSKTAVVEQVHVSEIAEWSALMLSKENLAELSELLGRNIRDADDLLLAARNVTTLSVNGVEGTDIVLEPYLLNRLKSRCHPSEDFPTFLRARVKDLLCAYAGC